MKLMLLMFGIVITSFIAYAELPDGGPYTEVVDEVEWTFKIVEGCAVIENESQTSAISTETKGDIIIPSVLGGRNVVSVGDWAFYSCTNLTSTTLPDGVTNIGVSAFRYCSGMTNVIIPSSVKVIDICAFGSCSISSIKIPCGIKRIPIGAFWRCNHLTDVYFMGDDADALDLEPGNSHIEASPFNGCHWDMIIHVPSTWKGRGKTLCGYTVVREGEDIGTKTINLTVTNVIVQYVLNSIQPAIAVPVSNSVGLVNIITEVASSGAVSVPTEWKDNYQQFETKFGTDFGKALAMKTGKKDGAGNDMFVWQDFVAGTDPTDPESKFVASVTIVDGVPVISYTPELTAEQAALRVYKTYGKMKLTDTAWTDITAKTSEERADYNFFKVTVEMK